MEKEWGHVVVLGAAGKMGSGIALLLLQEMASMPKSRLTLLDTNSHGFEALSKYLREHLLKYAERNINRLRLYFNDRKELIDNGDMIEAFVVEALDRVRYVTSLGECVGAKMVFEAILEDIQVKTGVFTKINEIADPEACYFTNTSSIPIHILEKKSGLNGRLIGFHFYNPPAIQQLLEIIVPKGAKKGLREFAQEIAERLNKIIVFSKDIAGFIGNGHFIREIVEGCSRVEEIKKKSSFSEAVCIVNTVTQDYLIRPMGLFQLIDYVGIDVAHHIAKIMTEYLPAEVFNTTLVNRMVSEGVKGGQNGDGTQKDGFFSYEKGKPVKVYDIEKKHYIPYVIPQEMKTLPTGHESWKALSKDKEKEDKLKRYFSHLLKDNSPASKLAVKFLERSSAIGHGLVKDDVARSVDDVDTVLKNGFFHLYGIDLWHGGK